MPVKKIIIITEEEVCENRNEIFYTSKKSFCYHFTIMTAIENH